MGGRGTNRIQSRTKELEALRQTASGGGGGAAGGGGFTENDFANARTGSGLADVGDLSKIKVIDMTYRGTSHKAADAGVTKGRMVIMDDKGNLHQSIQASSGSTRVTFEFKDFVIKVEGLLQGGYPGQNRAEEAAYNMVKPTWRKNVATPLGKARNIGDARYNGVTRKNVNIIPIERVTLYRGRITQAQHLRLEDKFHQFQREALRNGDRIGDLRFPNFGEAFGHNVFITKTLQGRLTFKAVDIPFDFR